MADQRKILLSVPAQLLAQADACAAREGINRSELIRRGMQLYITDKHKIEIREKMRKGYEQMASINKEWAETGMAAEYASMDAYEAILSESDKV